MWWVGGPDGDDGGGRVNLGSALDAAILLVVWAMVAKPVL